MKKPSFLNFNNPQFAPLFALLAMTINAHADATWIGADGVWATPTNWSAAVPGAADTATFSSTGQTGTLLAPINLGETTSVNSIVFDSSAQDYVIGGTAGVASAINLSSGGSIIVNGGTQTFSLSTTVASVNATAGGTATITGNTGTTTLVGAGPGITTTGGLNLGISANGPAAGTTTVTFDGSGVTTTAAIQIASIANTATSQTKIIKNGTGVLVLGSSSNTNIWGGFEVTGGTVIANNATAMSNRGFTIGGGATLQMNASNATSFNQAAGNVVINGDANFHFNNTGNWGLGQTTTGTANTSQFSSTGNYVATFSVSSANQNGIRISANNGGFTGTYKLGQNGALTFNAAARGSSSATLNMGDAGFGSHYFSTGVALHDTATQAIQPIKFGALTGTDSASVMSGRQNVGSGTTGTQFEIGGLGTNTAYAGNIRDGSTAGLLLQSNGTTAAINQVASGTHAASTYTRNSGAAGVQGTTELVKVGNGTLTLTGVNNHTGGTVIKGGTIAVSSDSALGATYDGSLRGFQLTLAATGGVAYLATDMPDIVLTGGNPGVAASANVYGVSMGASWSQNNVFVSFSSQANDSTAGSITNTETGSGYISVPTVSFTGGTISTPGTAPVASVRVQGLVTLDGGTLQTDAGITSNRAIVIEAGGGTINTQGFDSTFSGNVNGSGNLGLVGGGTVTLSAAINSLTGTATVGPNTALDLAGALAGSVLVNSTGTIGGTGNAGTIGGTLHLDSGAMLDVSDGLLTVATGQTVSFGGFDFNNIIGFDVFTAGAGIYKLIDGDFTLDSTNIAHFGVDEALNLGGGMTAYFQEGSFDVVIIPEPGAALLGGLGALALLRRRRR